MARFIGIEREIQVTLAHAAANAYAMHNSQIQFLVCDCQRGGTCTLSVQFAYPCSSNGRSASNMTAMSATATQAASA
jgi:hypothetical protein